MSIAIIDCGAGNLHSVEKAVRKVSAESGKEVHIVTESKQLLNFSHIILPGVGAFADCMQGLSKLDGMVAALEQEVLHNKKPFLGICVGMQMLFEQSHEHGTHAGLGWLKGTVEAIDSKKSSLKIPHMGWNELQFAQASHPVLEGVEQGAHAYFVHSYHVQCADAGNMLATVEYGQTLCAAVARDNIIATQFHPEKSQAAGLQLLRNFVGM